MIKNEIDVMPKATRIELTGAQMCNLVDFLSAIRTHVSDNRDQNKPEHVNLVLSDNVIKRCKQFYNDMTVVQNTIKSLYATPVLLSAFMCGLEQVYPLVANVVNLNGSYKVDNINDVLNSDLL